MDNQLPPSQLFALLNSSTSSSNQIPRGLDKLDLALQAWPSPDFKLPKKEFYFAQWALGLGQRLEKGKGKESMPSCIHDPRYWSLLRHTLSATDAGNLTTLTARNPTILLASRLFTSLPSLITSSPSPSASDLLPDALECLKLTLPFSLERAANFDRVFDLFLTVLRSFPGLPADAGPVTKLATFALEQHLQALENAPPRKAVIHLLDTAMPAFLRAYHRFSPPPNSPASEDSPMAQALLDVAVATLFSLENLLRLRNKKQLGAAEDGQTEEAEWFAAFRGAARNDTHAATAVLRLLPRLYARLLATLSLPSHAPKLFPFTHKASSTSSEHSYASAVETHQLLCRRSAAMHFLASAHELVRDPRREVALEMEESCRGMVGVLKDAGLYGGPGGKAAESRALADVAGSVVAALGSAEDEGVKESCVRTLEDLLALDPTTTIAPNLEAILRSLARLTPPRASAASSKAFLAAVRFLEAVLGYHSKAKSLPGLVLLLDSSLSSISSAPSPPGSLLSEVMHGAVMGPEFTVAWMREVGDGLAVTQVLPTVEGLAERLVESVKIIVAVGSGAGEREADGGGDGGPPKKKRRKAAENVVGEAAEAAGEKDAARCTITSHILAHFIASAPLAPMRLPDRAKLFSRLSALRSTLAGLVLSPRPLKRLRKGGEVGRRAVAGAARVVRAVLEKEAEWVDDLPNFNKEGAEGEEEAEGKGEEESKEEEDGKGKEEGKKAEEAGLSGKVLEAMGKAVERAGEEEGEPEMRAELARLLLQEIDRSPVPTETLSVILDLIFTSPHPPSTSTFDGVLACLPASSLPCTIWSLLATRYLPEVEIYAAPDPSLTKKVAQLVFETAPQPSLDEVKGVLKPPPGSFDSVTDRLLEGPVFFELPKLRPAIVECALERLSLGLPSGVLSPAEALALEPIPKLDPIAVHSAAHTIATLSRFPPQFLGARALHDLIEACVSADLLVSRRLTSAEKKPKRAKNAAVLQAWSRHFVASRGAMRYDGVGRGKLDSVVAEAGVLPALVFTETVKQCEAGSHLAQATASLLGNSIRIMLAYRAAAEERDAFAVEKAEKVLAALDAFLGSIEGLVKGTMNPDQAATVGGKVAELSVTDQLVLRALEVVVEGDGGGAMPVMAMSSKPLAPLHMAVVVSRLHDFLQIGDSATDHLLRRALSVLALLHRPALSPASSSGLDPTDLKHLTADNVAAALRLLQHHIDRRRTTSIVTAPFEVLIASYIAAFEVFGAEGDAATTLVATLKPALRSSQREEYAAALEGVSEDVKAVILEAKDGKVSDVRLKALMKTAALLLSHAPEGMGHVARQYLPIFLLLCKEATRVIDTLESFLCRAAFIETMCEIKSHLLGRQEVAVIFGFVLDALRPLSERVSKTVPDEIVDPAAASRLYERLCSIVAEVARHRRIHIIPLFPLLVISLSKLVRPLQRGGFDSSAGAGKKAEREAQSRFPPWVWAGGPSSLGAKEAAHFANVLKAVTARTPSSSNFALGFDPAVAAGAKKKSPSSLVPALGKHAPFFMVVYLRACADSLVPLPATVKGELQGGVFEVMGAMGKHERGALLKSFLGRDDETERVLLKQLWRVWDEQRYRGKD